MPFVTCHVTHVCLTAVREKEWRRGEIVDRALAVTHMRPQIDHAIDNRKHVVVLFDDLVALTLGHGDATASITCVWANAISGGWSRDISTTIKIGERTCPY